MCSRYLRRLDVLFAPVVGNPISAVDAIPERSSVELLKAAISNRINAILHTEACPSRHGAMH